MNHFGRWIHIIHNISNEASNVVIPQILSHLHAIYVCVHSYMYSDLDTFCQLHISGMLFIDISLYISPLSIKDPGKEVYYIYGQFSITGQLLHGQCITIYNNKAH